MRRFFATLCALLGAILTPFLLLAIYVGILEFFGKWQFSGGALDYLLFLTLALLGLVGFALFILGFFVFPKIVYSAILRILLGQKATAPRPVRPGRAHIPAPVKPKLVAPVEPEVALPPTPVVSAPPKKDSVFSRAPYDPPPPSRAPERKVFVITKREGELIQCIKAAYEQLDVVMIEGDLAGVDLATDELFERIEALIREAPACVAALGGVEALYEHGEFLNGLRALGGLQQAEPRPQHQSPVNFGESTVIMRFRGRHERNFENHLKVMKETYAKNLWPGVTTYFLRGVSSEAPYLYLVVRTGSRDAIQQKPPVSEFLAAIDHVLPGKGPSDIHGEGSVQDTPDPGTYIVSMTEFDDLKKAILRGAYALLEKLECR